MVARKMKERDEEDSETNLHIDVSNVAGEGTPPNVSGKLDRTKKFPVLRSFSEDVSRVSKGPVALWDDSFIGEVISDDCHPGNSTFLIGAVGGLSTGILTGFFGPSRVPFPVRTPIPFDFLPNVQKVMRTSIVGGSLLWRMSKRTLLGAVLFAVLECDFKDLINKPSEKWKGSIAAGAVSGAVFGLRGGFFGLLLGTTLFALLPAGRDVYTRRQEIRSRLFNPD